MGANNFIIGVDENGVTREVQVTDDNALKTDIGSKEVSTKDSDLNSILKQILVQQKITNKILSDSFAIPLFTEHDLEC